MYCTLSRYYFEITWSSVKGQSEEHRLNQDSVHGGLWLSRRTYLWVAVWGSASGRWTTWRQCHLVGTNWKYCIEDRSLDTRKDGSSIIGAEKKSPGRGGPANTISAVRVHDNREVIEPLTTNQTCFQACFKVPVETLVKTICLWVRCDAEACSTKEVHEGMPKIRIELLPLLSGDRRWNTKAWDPTRQEGWSAEPRGGINHWNCLGSSGVSVNANKQVIVAFGWRLGPNNAHMNTIETSVGWGEGLQLVGL